MTKTALSFSLFMLASLGAAAGRSQKSRAIS
jgi:hypothetical protein